MVSLLPRLETPSPDVPASCAERRFKDTGYPVEWCELYRPGGFHPVHFNDFLRDGKYRVIRKLGFGSYSTVWLAMDTTAPGTYAAIKIMMAKYSASDKIASELEICSSLRQHEQTGSDHLVQLRDSFQHTGPNGTHLCLVYDPMGGTVASMLEHLYPVRRVPGELRIQNPRYPKWLAKRILKHTLLGLDCLHGQGVVHGDLQPGNLLFAIKDLSTVNAADLRRSDVDNSTQPLERKDGRADLWAPRYLARSQPLYNFANIGPRTIVKISDFGAAFFKSSPPGKIVTPIALRAPEVILKEAVDEKIDIWSFGCLLYELLTGTRLFAVDLLGDDKEEDADDTHWLEMNDIVGDLPDRIMSLWPRSADWFGPNRERLKGPPETDNDNWDNYSLDSKDMDLIEDTAEVKTAGQGGNSDENSSEAAASGHDQQSDFQMALEEKVLEEEGPFINDPLEVLFEENKPDDIDSEEAEVITGLIRRILRYDPSERPSSAELLKDEWFNDA